MPTTKLIQDPCRPRPAPAEYAGQWVAWNKRQSEIIAHGEDFATVHRSAVAAGYPDAVMQKVRRPGTSFIGGA